jgi:hypothetical protein
MIPDRLLKPVIRYIQKQLDKHKRRVLYRAVPALRVVDREIEHARRSHRPVRTLEAKKQRLMTAALRGERV